MKIHEQLSAFYDDRSAEAVIDTVVIHSMYNPYCGPLPEGEGCIQLLDQLQLSAHYLVEKNGVVWQLVPDDKRAWHAGISQMPDGREGVNYFSIGIELLNNGREKFTPEQYQSLSELVFKIAKTYPLKIVVGHEHIALPHGRKTDPGALFDWTELKRLLTANPATAALEYPF